MENAIFRQYDIRGKVGSEFILENVYDLARAIAYYFISRNAGTKTVVLGMDGRMHSEAIKQQLCLGLQASGLDVVFVGICTSPVIYFAMHTMPVDAGLMITASHNPKEYNGIKICFGKEMVWGNEIQKIQQLFSEKAYYRTQQKGLFIHHDLISVYNNWLVNHFEHLKNKDINAIIDCGNGTAGGVLPQLIEMMNWRTVTLLYKEIDGHYPHHEPDPTVEANMQDVKQQLMQTDHMLGIGLDGDCDRMAAMTKDGFLVPGDQLLALFAHSIIQDYPEATVVFDVKASSALTQVLDSLGARPIMAPTGHALIKDAMNMHNAVLGGELSCHFFFHDKYFGYDDGIYAMLRLFELLIKSGSSLKELLSIIPPRCSSPEYRIGWDEQSKCTVINNIHDYFKQKEHVAISTIDGVRVTMPYGWGLIRASNTQAAISIRFESDTHEGLRHIKQDFIAALDVHKKRHELETLWGV